MHKKLLTHVAVIPFLLACSSSEEGSGSKGSGSGDPNGVDPAGGLILGGGPGQDGGVTFMRGNQTCVAESVATESAPLDIYVMFDQSCSMSCVPERTGAGLCCPGEAGPRIDVVRGAMDQFLGNPKSAGIAVGLGFFGHMQPGATSCDPGAYAQPAVPMGVLPTNANALVQSLHAAVPTGETPTGAAIRGACSYAQGWKRSNMGHQVIILLVTDGYPEAPVSQFTCQPSLPDAVQAAADCLAGDPQVPTYVLGVGQNLDNLRQIAEAGGTQQAYLAGGTGDVGAKVLEALNAIRDSANVPCSFKVPPPPAGQTLDPALVNVTYIDTVGQSHVIPGMAQASCGAEGGWFYDNPDAPATLTLCPESCNVVTAQLIAGSAIGRTSRLDLQYGCSTVVVTR